jgi:hypothetical protein
VRLNNKIENLKRQGPIWAVASLDGWMDGWMDHVYLFRYNLEALAFLKEVITWVKFNEDKLKMCDIL